MVFLAIRSVQNVQNDRTNIFGLKISRNTPYGVTSYLYIMISVRCFRKKSAFLKKHKMGKTISCGTSGQTARGKMTAH